MLLETIKTEVTTDPLGIGYPTMSDEAIATSLNSVVRTKIVPITSAELLAWAGGGADDASSVTSRYERIETAAAGHSSGAVRGACKAAIRLIDRDSTVLDLSLADRVGMVDALVAGGVLTSSEKTELVTKATVQISRAAELGLSYIYAADVTGAKNTQ